MNVKKLALGAYQTNCYLLWEGSQAVVIDPGYEPDTILRALETPSVTMAPGFARTHRAT